MFPGILDDELRLSHAAKPVDGNGLGYRHLAAFMQLLVELFQLGIAPNERGIRREREVVYDELKRVHLFGRQRF